jgi:hypothetical protein
MMHVPEVNIYCGCMLQRRVDDKVSAPALVKGISNSLQMDIDKDGIFRQSLYWSDVHQSEYPQIVRELSKYGRKQVLQDSIRGTFIDQGLYVWFFFIISESTDFYL